MQDLQFDSFLEIDSPVRRYSHNRKNWDIKPKIEFHLPKIEIEDIINHEELKHFLDDLRCPICINIIEDPRTCINCEANFCYDCIKEWENQDKGKQCPCCRDQGQERYLKYREREKYQFRFFNQCLSVKYTNCPKIFQKILNVIQVTCHNEGCNCIVKFDERQTHLKSCLYQPYNCPNEGCTERVTKLSESEHTKVCEYRKEKCKYCQQEYCVNQMFIHEDFCEENKQKCVDCKKDIQVRQQQEHEKTCQYKKLKCKICNNLFYRKFFSSHTKAECYEKLYKNSAKDNKKKDKELSNKDQQINKMISIIENLKQQLLTSEVDKTMLLQQIEEINQIPNQNQQEQEQSQSSEDYPDDFESFENQSNHNNTQDQVNIIHLHQILYKKHIKEFIKHYYKILDYNKIDISDKYYSSMQGYYMNIREKSISDYLSNCSQEIKSHNQFREQEQEHEEEEEKEHENDRSSQGYIGQFRQYHSIQNNHQSIGDDSYFQGCFANSFDRKEFFHGIEDNLLL